MENSYLNIFFFSNYTDVKECSEHGVSCESGKKCTEGLGGFDCTCSDSSNYGDNCDKGQCKNLYRIEIGACISYAGYFRNVVPLACYGCPGISVQLTIFVCYRLLQGVHHSVLAG